MAGYFYIMGGLIFLILLVSFWTWRLAKENKEARRIMDRLYNFVDFACRQVERGDISRAQEKAIIQQMGEALCGSSMIESLRAVDEVIHGVYHGTLRGRPLALITEGGSNGKE